jgi:hypothetical protein
MRKLVRLYSVAACAAMLLLSNGVLSAGEKKLMHCFYFTPVEGASQADWDAFAKSTDALPGKIPGLTRVWRGKLARNLTILSADQEATKKLRGGEKSVTGQVSAVVRQYGVCMELDSAAALKTYADHPAHTEWDAIYSKVRQYGTTTFDIIGQ